MNDKIIVNNRKYKVLTAEPNWRDILEKDWVYYFTWKAAEREEWGDILWYEGIYQVSNMGNIKSLEKLVKTGYWSFAKRLWKARKSRKNKEGYRIVGLSKDGIRKLYGVHRLVGEAFIFNIWRLPQINHKNGKRDDNRVENLERCTNWYNQKHSYNNLWRKWASLWKYGKDSVSSKKILQCTKWWKFIKERYWWYEIERAFWYDSWLIYRCCKNINKTAYWYTWLYG